MRNVSSDHHTSPLLGCVAEHPLYLRAGVKRSLRVLYRVYIGDRGDLLDEGAVLLFSLLEPFLGKLTLCDVVDDTLERHDVTVLAIDSLAALLHVPDPSIPATYGVPELETLATS